MILIVRHGKGKARLYPYMNKALQYLQSKHPALPQRVVIHETGNPIPGLDNITAVVFWLADPLRERHPACYAEALEIAAAARSRNLRIINPPESLSNAIKSVQARLWRQAGLPTPAVARFETYDELLSHAAHLSYPLLIRADECHGQAGIQICRNPADLHAIPKYHMVFPAAISELVDVRKTFLEKDPGSVWASFYHKKRLLVLGDMIRTKHIFFSSVPVVSANTCRLRLYRGVMAPLGWLTYLDPSAEACIREDVDYWKRGHEHDTIMLSAVKTLGLDFAAIDYSSLADGRVVLWEANPYCSLPRLFDIMAPGRRHGRERIASYYHAISNFLASLP